jgi:hypothetical protein
MGAKYRKRSLLLVGAFAVSTWACASGSLSVKSLGPSDLGSLAGTWEGTGRGLLADDRPITLTISPDGTFTTTGSVYAMQGTVQVQDGGLFFTGGFQASDRQAPSHVATAMLVEEKDSGHVVQILSGSGFSSGRGVSFLVKRPKPGGPGS